MTGASPATSATIATETPYFKQTLSLPYVTLRSMWQHFEKLKRSNIVYDESTQTLQRGNAWREDDLGEKIYSDVEQLGDTFKFASWMALYRCYFPHRCIR